MLSRRLGYLFAALLTGCSGGRSDTLDQHLCSSSDDCGDGLACVAGMCHTLDPALINERDASAPDTSAPGSASVSARSEGAAGLVQLTIRDGDSCDVSGESPSCDLALASTVRLEAPEVAGHRFRDWSGDEACSSAEPVLTVVLDHDLLCVANYVQRLSARLETSDGVEIGSASATSDFADCAGARCTVDLGEAVVLEVPARDGFRFIGIEGAGCEQRTGRRVTVQLDAADVVCTARYEPSLTVRGELRGAAGQVTASSSSANADCLDQLCAVDAGSEVTLTAPTLPGYRFSGWSGDAGCSASAEQVVLSNVQQTTACVASYVPVYRVAVGTRGAPNAPNPTASSASAFAQCDAAGCSVDAGSSVNLAAASAPGYRFDGWEGAGCGPASGAGLLIDDVEADLLCIARYVRGVAVSGIAQGASANVVASSSSSGAQCAGGSCSIDEGGTVALSAPDVAGHRFLGWSGDPGCASGSQDIAFSNVQSSLTCVANYASRFIASALASPSQGGGVSASSQAANAACTAASCNVDAGSDVVLTATPAGDYRFTGWTGGGACTGASAQLILRALASDLTCTANFARIPRAIAWLVSPNAAGVVTATPLADANCGTTSCTVLQGGALRLSVQANPGFSFSGWTSCVQSANTTITLNPVTNDQTCIANFTAIRYNFTAIAETTRPVTMTGTGLTCQAGSCNTTVGYNASVPVRVSLNNLTDPLFPTSWGSCAATNTVVAPGEIDVLFTGITSDRTCRATFSPGVVFTAIAPRSAGVITTSTPQYCTVAPARTTCIMPVYATSTITANALPGHTFIQWAYTRSYPDGSNDPIITQTSPVLNLRPTSADGQWVAQATFQ